MAKKRKGRRAASPERVFMRRTANIYASQRRRAGAALDYTLAMLRDMVRYGLEGGRCPCCGGALRTDNFGLDHELPVARGGGHSFRNLVVMCMPCNEAKGPLSGPEWFSLREALAWFPAAVREHTMRRLRAGGRARIGLPRGPAGG
ncbi:MAG: HNH endonuclease [Gemmataceae bacterium]